MVRVIAIILAAVITIGILGTIGFVGVKTGAYIINQNFNISEALEWAWEDYTNFVTGIFEGAKGENDNYKEWEYTINKYIEVKGCTSL